MDEVGRGIFYHDRKLNDAFLSGGDLMQVAVQIPASPARRRAAVAAAVAHAEANGWKINAAVVDRGGNLMAFLRMPGAFIHSIDIAIDKAYTAASFGFPTKAWMGAIGHDEGMKFGFSASRG
jgi:uncharacterized protein GlcG (DUF336 family)